MRHSLPRRVASSVDRRPAVEATPGRFQEETVIVVHKGVALAAFIPPENVDYEAVDLSTNPKFIEILERSRTRYQEEGGISGEEMRRRFREGL